jgi:hypothetical protein
MARPSPSGRAAVIELKESRGLGLQVDFGRPVQNRPCFAHRLFPCRGATHNESEIEISLRVPSTSAPLLWRICFLTGGPATPTKYDGQEVAGFPYYSRRVGVIWQRGWERGSRDKSGRVRRMPPTLLGSPKSGRRRRSGVGARQFLVRRPGSRRCAFHRRRRSPTWTPGLRSEACVHSMRKVRPDSLSST